VQSAEAKYKSLKEDYASLSQKWSASLNMNPELDEVFIENATAAYDAWNNEKTGK